MRNFIIGICAAAVLITVFVFYRRMTAQDYVNPVVNLDVTSDAFEDGGMIPVKHTGRHIERRSYVFIGRCRTG